MPRFDRYLLSQLLSHFGFFALVLVGVYWVNRAVALFDQLMGDGQSALVFLEFSLLTLPNVIKLVLPAAGFVAAVFVTNKLIGESELVVMQATGFSPMRMARPVLYFGLLIAVMMMTLVHVLVPLSRASLMAERAALSENITARFLSDGQFTHPAKNVTLYITEIDATGQLRGLFLQDDRKPDETITYTAKKALFVRGETGPKLVMFEGMAQTITRKTQHLSVTRFADFTYDLGALLTRNAGQGRKIDAVTTYEVLTSGADLMAETGATPQAMAYALASRIAEPFLAPAMALIGFAALQLGGFSRMGVWRKIAVAVVLLIMVQGIATVTGQLGQTVPGGAGLAFVAPVLGMGLGFALLWWSGRARLRPRQARAADGVVA